MTTAQLTAASAMHHALTTLVPCSCHLKTHYNYDGKGERICAAHAAAKLWDEANNKTNGEAK